MKYNFFIILCALGVLGGFSARAAEKLNVLLIMADDLRDFGGALTREVVKAPNLDRLAACALSGRSRSIPSAIPAALPCCSGLRCEQTGIVGNQQSFRETLPDAVTFPQLLRQHGWTTRSIGKILHAANTGSRNIEQLFDQMVKLSRNGRSLT